MKHLNITIKGRVQGVSFRAATKAVADQLGIRGIVTNHPDGSVYIEAEANEALLDMFLDFCKEGSENSIVESLETNEGELKNYRNFEVLKRGIV